MTEKQTYILGGAQTDFARNWTKEGKTFLSMMKEVVEDSLRNTGLDYEEILRLRDENRLGVFVGNFDAEQYANQGHLGAFLTEVHPSFYGAPSARYEAACASGSVALSAANAHLRAGDFDLAIVLGVEIMKTVDSAVGGDFLGTAAYYEKEALGISFPFPKLFGKLADLIIERNNHISEERIMENLAHISTINYQNAKLNPLAQTRSWFMNKNHACQRGGKFNMQVGGKLGISDCSQVTDGASVLLLANPTYMKKFKNNFASKGTQTVKNFPLLKGWGHRVAPIQFKDKAEESKGQEYILPWTRQAVLDAYKTAKCTVEKIDVFETHDCFTSSEYAAISAFGITPSGDEYKAIEDGSIEITGKNPINPSGGLIGAGHPVGASGIRMAFDIYKQVTDQAGDYQVKNAKTGLMLNIGGSATTNMTFVIGQE